MKRWSRIAIFGDTHGNLPALEAAWADMDMPAEFAEMLRQGRG